VIDFGLVTAGGIAIIAGIETAALAAGAEVREENLELTRTGTILAWITVVTLLGFGAAYEILATWRWGGTPGKWRTKVRVVSHPDRESITLGQAAARFAVWGVPFLCCLTAWGATFPRYPIPSLIFFLGAFASLGLIATAWRNPEGRGVHDRIAGTEVITRG
jgi:uncharacterized RDD family membrane protein YckC